MGSHPGAHGKNCGMNMEQLEEPLSVFKFVGLSTLREGKLYYLYTGSRDAPSLHKEIPCLQECVLHLHQGGGSQGKTEEC